MIEPSRKRRKPPQNARHHWWPTALLKQWEDSNILHVVTPDGKLKITDIKDERLFVRGAHDVVIAKDGPWIVANYSFEPYFDRADSVLPRVVELILNTFIDAEHEIPTDFGTYQTVEFDAKLDGWLTEICASLIARSPQIRYKIAKTISYYHNDRALEQFSDKQWSIVAENQDKIFDAAQKAISSGGKIAILRTDYNEFSFGDGFYCNMGFADPAPLQLKFIIPILPNIAIIYMRLNPLSMNININSANRNAFIVQLNKNSTDEINHITQIYSRSMIFYKTYKPDIKIEFNQNKHLMLKYHIFDLYDNITHFFNRHHRSTKIIRL